MIEKSNTQNQLNQYPSIIPQYGYQEDEISLVELWLIVARHKRVFWCVFSVILVMSLAAVLLLTKRYTLSSSIEIGRTMQDDKSVLIESPETVKAKLDNALIPKILNQYEDEKVRLSKIDVTTPNNSDLVIIGVKVKEKDIEKFSKVLTEIAKALQQEHEKIIGPIRSRIKSSIEQNKIEFEKQKDMNFIEQDIRNRGVEQTSTNVVQKQFGNFAASEYVWLAFQKEQYINELKNEIDDLSHQLDVINDTRAITAPIRSQKPTGMPKVLIIFMGGALAILFGLFSTFIAEFITKVRRYKELEIKS